MRVSDFYNDSTIIEGFGKSRTFEVIRHLKSIWPGFPTKNQDLTIYNASWIVWILGNCKNANAKDVRAAIARGKDLKSDGELFIVWFGELLLKPELLSDIDGIYIFYDGDNCVQVLYKDGSIKIFQGERKANSIRRATLIYQEFLFDLSSLIRRSHVDHCPNWSFGENNEVFRDEDPQTPFGRTGKNVLDKHGNVIATEVLDTNGNLIGLIEDDNLKILSYE